MRCRMQRERVCRVDLEVVLARGCDLSDQARHAHLDVELHCVCDRVHRREDELVGVEHHSDDQKLHADWYQQDEI